MTKTRDERSSWARRFPLMTRVLLVLVLPGVVLVGAAIAYLRMSLPPDRERISVEDGKPGSAEILRDSPGRTRIVADTDEGAYFALGYAHAQDRLWQMEMQRRLGEGRLSEVLGPSKLRTDEFMRTLGLARAAREALTGIDTPTHMALAAYARGVNAWLRRQPTLPPEFLLFGFRPRPWTEADSLLQIKLMALSLAENFRDEINLGVLVQELGVQRAAQLRGSSIDEHSIQTAGAADLALDSLARFGAQLETDRLLSPKGAGSNAWVLSGRLSRTGHALLANDPHLGTQIPSTWYLAELRGAKLHVVGATVPGLPCVVIGHNDRLAWGVTAYPADVQDLFIERLHPTDETKYEVDGRWETMQSREELIEIARDFPAGLRPPREPVRWLVRRTRHGPLISDAITESGQAVALRWTALYDRDTTVQGLLKINAATDLSSFRAGLSDIVAPTLVFLYADVDGHIAKLGAGSVPKRCGGQGRLPEMGWLGARDWCGLRAASDLPAQIDPPEGFLVAANEASSAAPAADIMGNWDPGYRYQRIRALIEKDVSEHGALDVDDLVRLQLDVFDLQALELLPWIRHLHGSNPAQQQALNYLSQWDGAMRPGSVPAALYTVWVRHFMRQVLADDLQGTAVHPERAGVLSLARSEIRPEFLRQIAAGRAGEWCDDRRTSRTETCDEIALRALDAAIQELQLLEGSRMAGWEWGDVQKTHYTHAASSSGRIFERLLDRETGNGGATYTVNVASSRFEKGRGYLQFMGPSYRQIIDVGAWSRSRFMGSTGQSGNPLSSQYDDQVAQLAAGEFIAMPFATGPTPN